MSKIILKGHIVVPEDDLEAVMEALPLHTELTLQEEGCLLFQVTQDQDRENIFHVYEEFRDRNSFERHQIRVRTSVWGEITKNVARHYQVEAID